MRQHTKLGMSEEMSGNAEAHAHLCSLLPARWGDAPVHTLAAAALLDRNEIHFARDIGYSHGSWANWSVAWPAPVTLLVLLGYLPRMRACAGWWDCQHPWLLSAPAAALAEH